ncbi:hypothetical protein EV191_11414 [Tamaricihabitans halophyticus]|uniref:DUF4293 family protein n=1 Tax=Tamaricihabitans halophyticus TaxID=1262583 RepID=A0A4R2QBF1_9PSEU|nr:hypothetical protein [Tamaricihabitans halophyticus]TCP46217.1 hypothetical protein EV191_11414 [Tamaricihabitans halophyticus]
MVDRRRTVVARILLGLASISALVAAVTEMATVTEADSARLMVETWRVYGLATFAALFALLACQPHGKRALWHIVIANKILLALTSIGFVSGLLGPGEVAGAGEAAIADSALSVMLLASYVLCRAWRVGTRTQVREVVPATASVP